MAFATAAEAAALHPAIAALVPGALPLSPFSSPCLPIRRRRAALVASFSSPSRPPPPPAATATCSSSPLAGPLEEARDIRLRHLVEAFDPGVPLPQALTPPSSWYTDPAFLDLELDRVFLRGWQAVGYTEQIQNPRDFFTGRLGNVHFVVCRDADGELHAFHNVCRHHASLLAYGSGQKSCFVCPYHGWTYALDGSLLKATRINGIQNFAVHVWLSISRDFGLIPLSVVTWGPFVLISMDKDRQHEQKAANDIVENEWLGSCSEMLRDRIDSSLKHVCRRKYIIECNWKIFCDNYLDGGYHVPYAHGDLASGLKLESYSTEVFEKVSIQKCESSPTGEDDFDRLGSKALYAFVYPNLMINRYGPWMDTNLVLPLGASKCEVVFDYFLDASLKDDDAFIRSSLEESEKVQTEDIELCEGVQKGLESPAYCSGRYAPNVEQAMHHFHCLLYESLNKM